jgi:hypothetical protein
MFDPTVFDNLKVVFEGAMYDLELGGSLQIAKRTDSVELSAMSRAFGMEAARKTGGTSVGSFLLTASLADLAAELLAQPDKFPGCGLELAFLFPVAQFERDCSLAADKMKEIWGEEQTISQQLQTEFGREPLKWRSRLTVGFTRKLDERHIDDIPSLLEHFMLSLKQLDEHFS